ncbi:MAG: Deoxyribodipyrimidine photo-lyase [Proteobacteria bacterium]|nr:Deoxyribodipyrimidine photo-lyase [Pseudomonadota bacterium]
MTTAILWFRRDLRLADNPALTRALATCKWVIPLYVHAPDESEAWVDGSASRWWLHHSLAALDESLRNLGSSLVIRCGPSLTNLQELARETGATRVFWNRLYEPASIARDNDVQRALRKEGVQVESCNSALLHDPWIAARTSGEPYKVFGAFWKNLRRLGVDFSLCPAPAAMTPLPRGLNGVQVADLGLLPQIPWDSGLQKTWHPGEEGAHIRLRDFLERALPNYPTDRDIPGEDGTSRLSPHLHFGEIGPRQIVAALRSLEESSPSDPGLQRSRTPHAGTGSEVFVRELAWREFAHHLLYHCPNTTEHPLDERFEYFPWVEPNPDILRAWQQGQTGIPLVDAGMRELWHTGWMHNRVRMVVASFLVKNLRIHWLEGARWFWDTLVDADLANNAFGWQWTTGCGADAAPFFRVFNPVLQGKKFDPRGQYVRRWVPELAKLPDAALHQPWLADPNLLLASGIHLGTGYPHPVADLKTSREKALAAFRSIRTGMHLHEVR